MIACDSQDAWDCIKSSGSTIQEEVDLKFFDKLDVRHRVQLIVKKGEEQKVILETGINLQPKISLSVNDSVLKIQNDNVCNLIRDYGLTKVYVTSPNIKEIRNGSGLAVLSEGVLAYPNLDLISNDASLEEDILTVGDFKLNIDVNNLNIMANGNSNFFIEGKTNQAFIGFFAGNSRFEGLDLTIQDLRFFHRSSNKIFVNPQNSITGKILSVGDVISIFEPQNVEVEELYKGRLIFDN